MWRMTLGGAPAVRQLSFIIEQMRRPSRGKRLEFKSLFAQQKIVETFTYV